MLIYMPAAIIFFSFLFLKKHGIFAMNISITLFVVLLPQLTIVTFARSQVPSRTIAVKFHWDLAAAIYIHFCIQWNSNHPQVCLGSSLSRVRLFIYHLISTTYIWGTYMYIYCYFNQIAVISCCKCPHSRLHHPNCLSSDPLCSAHTWLLFTA